VTAREAGSELGRAEEAERRDRWAWRFVEAIPALAEAVRGAGGFAELLKRRSNRSVVWRRGRIHVESFAGAVEAPTILFHHGYGAYGALYAPFLGLLSREGLNVVSIDRPGHGLSEGRRGDCTVEELAEVTRLVADTLVDAQGPTVVFGSSAGGMLTSCLVPYLGDTVDGYICHGVHQPAYARAHMGRLLRRCAEAVPSARLPYRLIPRHIRDGISDNAIVREWFRPGSDALATFRPTLRSVFSMTVDYHPPQRLSAVDRPVLVLAGSDDRMLPLESMNERVRRLHLVDAEIRVIEGGHMLLHERPCPTANAIVHWLGRTQR
jgi:pimeloyl-ACP methyl ester carboxylesterase